MNTTAEAPFFSKSNSMGTSRWQFVLPEANVIRGYVIDAAPFNLANRWFAVTLRTTPEGYAFHAHGLGSAENVSLESADLAAQLGQAPIISTQLNVGDEAEALVRFERVVSNVMHKMLAPVPEVAFLWGRFATTDGTDAYRA